MKTKYELKINLVGTEDTSLEKGLDQDRILHIFREMKNSILRNYVKNELQKNLALKNQYKYHLDKDLALVEQMLESFNLKVIE